PHRPIGPAEHSSTPDDAQLLLEVRLIHAQGHPFRPPPWDQRHHAPRTLHTAAARNEPHAEASAPAIERARATLDKVKQGVPDQRSIGKEPDCLTGRALRNGFTHRGFQSLFIPERETGNIAEDIKKPAIRKTASIQHPQNPDDPNFT